MFELHHSDNREVLKTMADDSIDSIVTDPPYELGFMGKKWDVSGIAYDVELWREVLRVLKPGGHLLAFSGSRTYHRMVVAIEDAGFEIRDQIMWIYGSGFPKSLDVSKAIDKSAGAEREVVGQKIRGDVEKAKTSGVTIAAADANKNNKAIFGYGIENITAAATAEAKQWQGWGTALKPAHEPIVVARKSLIGTVADNVLTYGTGGLNIDGARVGNTVETWPSSRSYAPGQMQPGHSGETQSTGDAPAGRWPANVIHDGSDEVVELFPYTHGSGNKSDTGVGEDKEYDASSYQISYAGRANRDYGSKGGSAARFFYCAKASKRDRNEGEVVNNHPTVKPTNLMRYLCRLVTPPNGIVLDPFMGSGSTGKAAVLEGFNFVGIEMTDEYLPIAKARIEFAIDEMSGKLL